MSTVGKVVKEATRYGVKEVFHSIPAHTGKVIIPQQKLIYDASIRAPKFQPKKVLWTDYSARVKMERKRANELKEKLFEAHYKSFKTFKKFPELLQPAFIEKDGKFTYDYSSSSYEEIAKLMKDTMFPMFYQQAATLASTLQLGEDIGLEDELTMLYFLNEVVDPMARFALDDSPPPHWPVAMKSSVLSLAQPAANVIYVGTNTHILLDFPVAFGKAFAELGVLPTVSDYSNSYATVKSVSDITAPAMQKLLGMNSWTATLSSPITPLVHQGIFNIRNYPYKKAVKQHENENVVVTYPTDEYIQSAKKTKLPTFGE
jgi:hypothetical protein